MERAWIRVIFLMLLSAKVSYATVLANGEILDHLEMIFISVIGNDVKAFNNYSYAANVYFVEKYLENDCNYNLCPNVTMGKFFGLDHQFEAEVERNFTEEFAFFIYKTTENLIKATHLNRVEMEYLKIIPTEDFEEITDIVMVPVLEYLMTRKIEKERIQAFMENLRRHGVEKFPCGDDYSLYEHVYREFLQDMKPAFLHVLHTQLLIGFKKYLNTRIPIPQISASEMISMDSYMDGLEFSKRCDQRWSWSLEKKNDVECGILLEAV